MFKLRTNLNLILLSDFTTINMPYVKTSLILLGRGVERSLALHFKACESDVWAPKEKLA